MRTLRNSEVDELNPCLKEQELTFKCFSDNNYSKEDCKSEIENYKLCKSFWYAIRSDRRKKGLRPLLPCKEERDQIKAEYFAKFKQQQ